MAEVFIGREALVSGRLTRGQLRWNYRTILPGVYLAKAVVAMGYPEPLVGVEFGTGSTDDLSRTGWKLIPGGADRPPKGIACVVRMAVSARGYPRWRLRRYYR